MANLRISEFSLNTELNGSEILLGVQSGNTVKISMADVQTFCKTVIGSSVDTDTVLTDVGTAYVDLGDLASDSNYVIDFLLMFNNGNTDGIRINPSGGEDILIQNIAYITSDSTTGIFSTDMDILNGELDIADATGILFVKGTGLIKTSVGVGDNSFSLTTRLINDIIGTTELLAGSYLTATKI